MRKSIGFDATNQSTAANITMLKRWVRGERMEVARGAEPVQPPGQPIRESTLGGLSRRASA